MTRMSVPIVVAVQLQFDFGSLSHFHGDPLTSLGDDSLEIAELARELVVEVGVQAIVFSQRQPKESAQRLQEL